MYLNSYLNQAVPDLFSACAALTPPIWPSLGRQKFTVRRQEFNQDSLQILIIYKLNLVSIKITTRLVQYY